MFAIREHLTEEKLVEMDALLAPPPLSRVKGVPAFYGSDEDAWSEFARQLDK